MQNMKKVKSTAISWDTCQDGESHAPCQTSVEFRRQLCGEIVLPLIDSVSHYRRSVESAVGINDVSKYTN